MDSLKVTDAASAAVATHPRVRLEDIEAAIARRYHFTADQAVGIAQPVAPELRIFSMCILVMRSGFVVTGESAPASPENFDPDLGKKFAYENAVRKLWPLMGFALRERLASQEQLTDSLEVSAAASDAAPASPAAPPPQQHPLAPEEAVAQSQRVLAEQAGENAERG